MKDLYRGVDLPASIVLKLQDKNPLENGTVIVKSPLLAWILRKLWEALNGSHFWGVMDSFENLKDTCTFSL